MATSPSPAREELAAASCPSCGSATAPLQEYCLECGVRLPLEEAGVRDAVATSWRGSRRWYAGDWAWPVLATLVLAVVAAAAVLAIQASRDGDDDLFVATGPARGMLTDTVPASLPPTTEASETATLPEEEAELASPPSSPRQRSTDPIRWPADVNGFTVVLASETSRDEATSKAKAARAAGLANVGVLEASDYSSLHPGYLVVFSGIYDSRAAAEGAVASARDSGYADAYPAQVAR